MLKSLYRYATLNRIENGIILSFSRKMQDQKSQYNNESQSYRRKTDSYDNILKREWVTVAREPNKKGLAFTVLNYNILSQQMESKIPQSRRRDSPQQSRHPLLSGGEKTRCQVFTEVISVSLIFSGSAELTFARYSRSPKINELRRRL
jgi:hypothetical protein